MEFGWWDNDPETGKHQVCVRIHGGNATWTRKQGHHTSWGPLAPLTTEHWDRLIAEAERRVPRRLISPKQFEAIRQLREQAR